ncbi:hypothetical protein JW805_03080 [Roseomonas aeriglobus]|nr:hypothetical protein [Roseomonas aeriglobus]
MDRTNAYPANSGVDPCAKIGAAFPAARPLGDRIIADRLPDSFALARSESEWLLTLLSADDLRYIFEGPADGKDKD